MASDAYKYATSAGGMGVDQYYQNIRDAIAKDPSGALANAAQWGISPEDIAAATKGATITPAAPTQSWSSYSTPANTPSAAATYATSPGGMGQERYYKNIQNFFLGDPTAWQVQDQMQKYGISAQDINNALGVTTVDKYFNDPNRGTRQVAAALNEVAGAGTPAAQPAVPKIPTLPGTGGGGQGSVPIPSYSPILPPQNVANYGIGLLPGETTYQSPIGTIAGGALFQAPQYSRPLPSGVDNYQSVTSAPRVTASIASLPKWVQNRIGMGPNFNAQPRNYKKGGLAQLAAGGQFSESDDLIQQQLDKLRKLEQNSTQLTAPQLAGDSMQLRADLLRRVQNSSAFQPTEEPSTAQQIGEAMLQAGSKGPAGIGQLIGRSGAEYFDAQKLRAADNQKRALAGLSLEERIIPDARLGVAGAGKGGAGPSPEQVRTVYQTSLNKNAQIAKAQGPWPSAEARNNWIRREAEKDVEMFLSRFAVNANVPRGEQLPEEGATESVTAPGAKPATSSTTTVFPRKPYPQSTSAPVVAPPARVLPEEARQKTFATGSEEMAMKDYSENIAPAAKVADSMLNVVNTIRQIPHTQDMFAPWREKVGAAFDAVGLDGKVVREAKNIKQIMPLLTKLANDRLLVAKGVQTEGDAQRAFNEFVKITDPKEAADFLYGWTKEIANRAKFKNELYRASKDQEGTWQKGEEYWNKSDYAQTPPMAVLNGKSWTFSDWRDKFLQANAKKGATIKDAISTWNNLTRGE